MNDVALRRLWEAHPWSLKNLEHNWIVLGWGSSIVCVRSVIEHNLGDTVDRMPVCHRGHTSTHIPLAIKRHQLAEMHIFRLEYLEETQLQGKNTDSAERTGGICTVKPGGVKKWSMKRKNRAAFAQHILPYSKSCMLSLPFQEALSNNR